MAEINDLEIIQNKLDALVVKIIQKENLDEDFRITYAQILEKINTKIDMISSTENIQQIGVLSSEIKNILLERKELVDARLNDLRETVVEIQKLLAGSLKTPELLAAFDKIQNTLHFLSEGQSDYKKSTEILLTSGIESIKDVNNKIHTDIKEQISYMKDITLTLRSISESTLENTSEIKDTVNNKVTTLIEKIQNADESINIINQNLTTLIQVVGSIFDDEDFGEVKSDVADILIKTALITEALKKCADKDDVNNLSSLSQKALNTIIPKTEMIQLLSEERDELNKFNKELIKNLESKILKKLEEEENLSNEIKNISEKILIQGTEVIKDEIWSIKDKINLISEDTLKEATFNGEINELKEEIIDSLSEESVALSSQINEISEKLTNSKDVILESISEESIATSTQINKISEKLTNSKDEIIDTISEESVALSSQIKTLDENLSKKKEEIVLLLSEKSEQRASQIEMIEQNLQHTKEDILDMLTDDSELTQSKLDTLDENQNINLKLTLNKLEEVKSEIKDVMSEESSSSQNQLNELSGCVSAMKDNLIDLIAEESKDSSNQIAGVLDAVETLKEDLTCVVLNNQQEQINESLQALQSKFITQLIQIAENITFEEEADEINDNIIENSDSIKEKISSSIDEIKTEISTLSNTSELNNEKILDVLENIDDFVQTDVNQDIKTLISSIRTLTNGADETKDYTYTMPDIESDLSKIRLDLNNIHRVLVSDDCVSTDEKEDLNTKINSIRDALYRIEHNPVNDELAQIKVLFDNLSEDVSSISKRTNKLVLESDSVSKTLKNNISSFTSLINDFYSSSLVYELKKKVDGISKSNEVINEAFMYLAEWVDSSTETFNKLQKDIVLVQNNIEELESSVTERVSRSLSALNKKIDEQEEKINILLSQQSETQEIKSLLEFIASQVSTANEKADETSKMSSKIASMEKQLKKIQTNVSLITEYLDEEEEEEDEDY